MSDWQSCAALRPTLPDCGPDQSTSPLRGNVPSRGHTQCASVPLIQPASKAEAHLSALTVRPCAPHRLRVTQAAPPRGNPSQHTRRSLARSRLLPERASNPPRTAAIFPAIVSRQPRAACQARHKPVPGGRLGPFPSEMRGPETPSADRP